MKNNEVWKKIEGFAGKYSISSHGRVASHIDTNGNFCKKKKILKPGRPKGYLQVRLFANGTHRDLLVHRLVAEAFISNPLSKEYVNHKDGNRANSHVDNLEWVTPSENTIHSFYHSHHKLKLTVSNVKKIKFRLENTKDSQKKIADDYGVDQSLISYIKNNKIWKYVT